MTTVNRTLGHLEHKTPGSREALDSGCLCPAEENHFGKGYMGGVLGGDGHLVFAVNEKCPLHGRKQKRRR